MFRESPHSVTGDSLASSQYILGVTEVCFLNSTCMFAGPCNVFSDSPRHASMNFPSVFESPAACFPVFLGYPCKAAGQVSRERRGRSKFQVSLLLDFRVAYGRVSISSRVVSLGRELEYSQEAAGFLGGFLQ